MGHRALAGPTGDAARASLARSRGALPARYCNARLVRRAQTLRVVGNGGEDRVAEKVNLDGQGLERVGERSSAWSERGNAKPSLSTSAAGGLVIGAHGVAGRVRPTLGLRWPVPFEPSRLRFSMAMVMAGPILVAAICKLYPKKHELVTLYAPRNPDLESWRRPRVAPHQGGCTALAPSSSGSAADQLPWSERARPRGG